MRAPVALRTRGDLTTNHRVVHCVVKAQRGAHLMTIAPVRDCHCGRPLSQASPPSKCPLLRPPLKRRRRGQLCITFHKSHFFASKPHTYPPRTFHQSKMSSFISCGEDQTAAWSQATHRNQQAAVSFDGSTAAPIAVSTDLLRAIEGYSHFIVTRPGLDLRTRSQ